MRGKRAKQLRRRAGAAAMQQFEEESGKRQPDQQWELRRIVSLSKQYYKQFKGQY